jgi:carbamoyl-phosphate synthase large subunit
LIPGAGGPAAIGCIKALRKSKKKFRIISVDPDPLSAGFFLSDKFYVTPYAKNEKSLIEKTTKICKNENIDVIMPTSGFDTPIHAKHRKKFEKLGICLPFSDYSVIQICENKLSLYRCIKNKDVLPFTTDNIEEIVPPCIVKPKLGKGSRNIFMCQTRGDLTFALNRIENPIFQKPLIGKEFTVDVLSDLKETPLIAVPRERIEIKAGITSKGKITLDEEIQRICLGIAKELNIKGPSCMQLKKDEEGKPKLIDVNPRLGGATIMTVLAGVNIPELLVKLCNDEAFIMPKPKEITVTRYWEELVIEH